MSCMDVVMNGIFVTHVIADLSDPVPGCKAHPEAVSQRSQVECQLPASARGEGSNWLIINLSGDPVMYISEHSHISLLHTTHIPSINQAHSEGSTATTRTCLRFCNSVFSANKSDCFNRRLSLCS